MHLFAVFHSVGVAFAAVWRCCFAFVSSVARARRVLLMFIWAAVTWILWFNCTWNNIYKHRISTVRAVRAKINKHRRRKKHIILEHTTAPLDSSATQKFEKLFGFSRWLLSHIFENVRKFQTNGKRKITQQTEKWMNEQTKKEKPCELTKRSPFGNGKSD